MKAQWKRDSGHWREASTEIEKSLKTRVTEGDRDREGERETEEDRGRQRETEGERER